MRNIMNGNKATHNSIGGQHENKIGHIHARLWPNSSGPPRL